MNIKIEKDLPLLIDCDINTIFLDPPVNYQILKGKIKGIVSKDEKEISGDLVRIEPDYVVLKKDKKTVQIFNYFSVSQYEEKDIIIPSSPSLLTYLFYSLFWSPIYTLNLKKDSGDLFLKSQITSKEEIEGEFSLIFENFQFDLGKRKISEDNSIFLFSKENLNVAKYYTYDTRNNYSEENLIFEMKSYCPPGVIHLYQDKIYEGEYPFPGGEGNIDFPTKHTNLISCSPQILEQFLEQNLEETQLHFLEENQLHFLEENHLQIEIINYLEEQVDLTIRHFISDRKLLKSSEEITENNNGYLEWDMSLKPTSKYVFFTKLTFENKIEK